MPVTTRSADQVLTTEASASDFVHIRQLARLVTRIYDDALRPFGISAAQYVLLRDLQLAGAKAYELGTRYDIEKSTISRNLSRLIALEYVTVGANQGRSGKTLTLTRSGEDTLRRARTAWVAVEQKVQGVMPAGSTELIRECISRIRGIAPPA